MIIELDEVEIGLLENGLRALENELSDDGEFTVHAEPFIIGGRTRRFTMLRAKLAGLPVPDGYLAPPH